MANNQQDTVQWKNVVFHFNGHKHNLAQVLAQGNAGPLIDVSVKDLDTDSVNRKVASVFEGAPSIQTDDLVLNGETIVYKINGKFYVLFGHVKAVRAFKQNDVAFKARLISSPAMKKCRIIEPQVEVAPAAPAYPIRRDYPQDRRPAAWNR